MTVKKLTPELLRKIVKEEVAKFDAMEDVEDRAEDTEEVDADEYADALEKKIDYARALKVEESRLAKRIGQIREMRRRIAKRIADSAVK